jgi:two-component system chemotaxis response regulator CheY
MSGTDGHQALEAIRQLEMQHGIVGSDGVKIIMTTALKDSKHCLHAFEQGCESYVTKPIHADELLEQVRTLLGEKLRHGTAPAGKAVRQSVSKSENRTFAPTAGSGPRARYLVVDDDGVCRALLKAMLSPFGQCTFAYDGQEAIDAVRLSLEDNRPFDLICLDIMMPGVSGHDALTQIRKVEMEHGIGGSDCVKVIMTTALSDSKHCIQSFREGCECYVTKPIDETELLGKMRDLGLLDPAPADV